MPLLRTLKNAGCQVAYIDGSFVTEKLYPKDFDACWDEDGVDPSALDPVLLRFEVGMVAQKEKYLGELYPGAINSRWLWSDISRILPD